MVEKPEKIGDGESRGLLVHTVDMRPIDVIYNKASAGIKEVLGLNQTATPHLCMKLLKQRTKKVERIVHEAKSTLNGGDIEKPYASSVANERKRERWKSGVRWMTCDPQF